MSYGWKGCFRKVLITLDTGLKMISYFLPIFHRSWSLHECCIDCTMSRLYAQEWILWSGALPAGGGGTERHFSASQVGEIGPGCRAFAHFDYSRSRCSMSSWLLKFYSWIELLSCMRMTDGARGEEMLVADCIQGKKHTHTVDLGDPVIHRSGGTLAK